MVWGLGAQGTADKGWFSTSTLWVLVISLVNRYPFIH